MPGKPHHSDKMKSCVADAVKSGKKDSEAYAICTASLKKAGDAIFKGAEAGSEEETRLITLEMPNFEEEKVARHIHLLGANKGAVRRDTFEGKEYIVVPVVALMEGVVHAVNASSPEFVPASSLMTAPAGWNGRPVMYGHPVRDRKQVSANEPEILEAQSIGLIFNTAVANKKLGMEAWIDPVKAEKVGGPKFLNRVENGELIEVSVGAFTTMSTASGSHNGKNYKGTWKDIYPDHLAFLDSSIGACSCDMGCGAHRAATHFIAAEEFVVLGQEEEPKEEVRIDIKALDSAALKTLVEKHLDPFLASLLLSRKGESARYMSSSLNGDSLDERMQEVNHAVEKKFSTNITAPSIYAYAQRVYDDHVIVSQNGELYSIPYTVDAQGEVTLSDTLTKVEMSYVAAMGARHSTADKNLIQSVHDSSVQLGAGCDRANIASLEQTQKPEDVVPPIVPVKAAQSGKGDKTMTPEQRAEKVKILVEHKHSGFTPADAKMLESELTTDERIESFIVAATARETEVKALEEAKTKPMTEEEFMKNAPQELKSLLGRQKQQETERKAELVTSLKAAQSEYAEAELASMNLDALERMSRVLGSETHTPEPNFAGQALPRFAASSKTDELAAPDPYAVGVKALQEKYARS